MMPARLEMEFVAARRGASPLGWALLALGIAATVWTLLDYRDLALESELLDARLGVAAQHATRPQRAMPVDSRALDEASAAVAQLSLPWTELLDELDAATQSSSRDIALLSIEPDPAKRRIRIGAEARTLPAALEFVERLQKAGALRYPLLDNHKVRTDEAERPVYFEMTADWSLSR